MAIKTFQDLLWILHNIIIIRVICYFDVKYLESATGEYKI